ncbi:MAG: cell division protein FtsK, partial [SAR116 cluster bacterium]|nr:cell division protein FtsK [SAR116 cluster bacterium]
VAEAGNAVAKNRPRKAAGKKKRQEPKIIDTGGDPAVPAAPATGQGRLDFGGDGQFRLPPAKLLKAPGKVASGLSNQELEATAVELETVLGDFSVKGEITESRYGPVVTRHDLEPAPGTKSQRVISLADDIARSMSAVSVRVAVVPGQNVIGIELPNTDRQVVVLREILDHAVWQSDGSNLPMALGKDIAGAPVIVDLAKMPHLLVAGTTGSGKSVGINAMILSLLYRHTPETCRMILVDPKMLELSVYDGIPHLLSPVVTEPSKAVTALKWAVREMETRYRNMAKLNVRNIAGYNERVAKARDEGEVLTRRVQTGFDAETGRPVFEEEILDLTPLPFIVVVIDEVADLMLVAGKEIEAAVQRLAQMARAAGIHVIMATQRPSVDVITGTIKANFPTRISFQVTSRIDSRTILGEQGAEQLLGRGDLLFMEGGGRVSRVHGPFVSDNEVQVVADFLRKQG